MMFSEDTSLAADELTARPPSSQDMSAYMSSAGRPVTGKPAATNIQKVSRTAKAVDAMSAMVMMMAAATGSGTGTAAAVAVDNDTATDSGPYTSDLEWLSNVYNPHRWNPVELPAASMLSIQCRDVMKTYLEALRRGSFWAAKSKCRIIRNHIIPILYLCELWQRYLRDTAFTHRGLDHDFYILITIYLSQGCPDVWNYVIIVIVIYLY